MNASLNGVVEVVDAAEAATREEFTVSVDREKLNQQVLDHNKLESNVK